MSEDQVSLSWNDFDFAQTIDVLNRHSKFTDVTFASNEKKPNYVNKIYVDKHPTTQHQETIYAKNRIRHANNVKQETMLTPQQQMMSSAAGPLVVSLFTTPLDVVKIRLQTQERLCSETCFLSFHGNQKYFTGTADAFLKISRSEGISSFWSGLFPTLFSVVPTTVLYFTIYERLKIHIETWRRSLHDSHPHIVEETPTWVPLLSGGLARMTAVTMVGPLELVRTKKQSQKMSWSELYRCMRCLVRTQGVRGLWNGYTATLLRDVPFSSLYWPVYEHSKATMNLFTSNRDSFLVNFMSGAAAGSVASTITLPFDVIKTIKQVEIGQSGMARTNMVIVRELMSNKGVRSLFAGLTPRLLKVTPSCAMLISTYEFCKGFFRQKNREK